MIISFGLYETTSIVIFPESGTITGAIPLTLRFSPVILIPPIESLFPILINCLSPSTGCGSRISEMIAVGEFVSSGTIKKFVLLAPSFISILPGLAFSLMPIDAVPELYSIIAISELENSGCEPSSKLSPSK